ncbi:MAG: hypothetical protein NC337_06775 [Roseburia sp.]|nr:hypothetical protein [Roseburia sp.]
MMATAINIKEIFDKYGLQVEEIEPEVFKVLNTDKEISTNELQWELQSCVLLTSDDTGYKKLPVGGVNSILAHIYYVIMGYDSDELGYKYDDIAAKEFGESIYRAYKYRPENSNSIDTIYAKGEL